MKIEISIDSRRLGALLERLDRDAAPAALDASAAGIREIAVTGDTATISIDSTALAHKLSGGPIKPKGGRKYLALPSDDAASRFPGMPRDNPALRAKPFGYAPHPDGGDRPALLDQSGNPVYWLVRKAVTRRDPRAPPADRDLAGTALEAVLDAHDALLQGSCK